MNQLEVCKHCDFAQCINIILNHPELVIKCIHFGSLKEYIGSIELPSESVIDKFNEGGCTSFTFTIDQLDKENTK